MKREDLRAHEPCSFDPTNDDHKHTRDLTPEEFHEIATAEGYVKLDVDVALLRAGWDAYTHGDFQAATVAWASLIGQVVNEGDM